MNNIERAQLKGRLLASNPSILQDVCQCYGLQCNMDQPAEIADTLLRAVDEGKVDVVALERIANFTKECGDIFIFLGKQELMELLSVQKSKFKSVKVEELKKSFFGKVAYGELKLEPLAARLRKEAIKKVLKPLEDHQSQLGVLVSKIQGAEIQMSTYEDTIPIVEAAIQKGRLNLDELTKEIKKIKHEKEDTDKSLEFQQLRADLKEIKKDIEDIKDKLKEGVRWKPSVKMSEEFSTYLRQFRLAQSKVSISSEKRIDALLMQIEKEGLSREKLLEIAMIITPLYNFDDLLLRLPFSYTSEEFYHALEEGSEQHKTFTNIVIRDIAKTLEQRLGLTREQFSHQLEEVADKGWVRFNDGAPLNHTPDDWFNYKNRKYYYMTLDKSSKR